MTTALRDQAQRCTATDSHRAGAVLVYAFPREHGMEAIPRARDGPPLPRQILSRPPLHRPLTGDARLTSRSSVHNCVNGNMHGPLHRLFRAVTVASWEL